MNENNVTLNPSTARRTKVMIGQEQARQEIEASLHPGDRSLQVVLVRAEGGMGKTRLMEEVAEKYGREIPVGQEIHWVDKQHEPEPTNLIIAKLVDVIDTRLHDRYRFVNALRDSLRDYAGGLNFSRFDTANDRVQLLTATGALYDSMNKAQTEATNAFILDLINITKTNRVVFLIDTVERLNYEASEWLLQKKLLKSSDLEIRAQQWLRALISSSKLDNVTLILAGRDREGKNFFDRITSAANTRTAKRNKRQLVNIRLRRFSLNETREYFEQLARDWQEYGPEYQITADHFKLVANPKRDQYKVIGLYTNGIPVRLALYAQVLVDGKRIPDALRLSFPAACDLAGLKPEDIKLDQELPETTQPKLRQLQWQVEEQFINLLFDYPDELRTNVLKTLVRAPNGLTAEQLHFALHASENQDPATWHQMIDEKILAKLVILLKEIASQEYLGKSRASLDDISSVLDEVLPFSATFRVGLQDEIYRIYAEHIGLLAEPVSKDTLSIRRSLGKAERINYQQSCKDEKDARLLLYKKLSAFANYQHRKYLARKMARLLWDESRFEERFTLDDPNTYRFPELSLTDVDERQAIHHALTLFEIEGMIYQLLQNPERNLNSVYITLEDDNDKAARQEEDFLAQAEMWRVLHDDWLMKFCVLHDRPQAKERGETSIVILRRVAEQENVARWIKRFVLRGQTKRAIEFGESVEKVIQRWPHGNPDQKKDKKRNIWASWNHTLAYEERNIWTEVGRIRRGLNAYKGAENIAESIKKLELLYNADVLTPAIVKDNQIEYGFAGTKDGKYPPHPAYMRLRRLLSHAHNNIGYSWRTLGRMHKAAQHYGIALEYVRIERGFMHAHRAVLLNNLSRALSELGWNSIGVCLDGRDLRLELAEEVPLAGSYNTLALIYDDLGRYEDAPLLSAKAIAYCRRANESRQLGLALRQMAESLRHVADRRRTGQRVAGDPENYFTAAEALLREARIIFEALDEAERQVEVNLEWGSLYRDRMEPGLVSRASSTYQQTQNKYYEKAGELLVTAERMAREHGQAQHALDARVNLARIHYYARKFNTATRILDDIENTDAYKKHMITSGHTPDPNQTELRDKNWIFRQLSTVQMIRGWIAFDQFENRVAEIRVEIPDGSTDEDQMSAASERSQRVKSDNLAQQAFYEIAKSYSLGIAYAELYSPRSRSIGSMQNNLYRRLRKANRSELLSFQEHLATLKSEYPLLSSVAMLEKLIEDFFGPGLTT